MQDIILKLNEFRVILFMDHVTKSFIN